MEKKVGIYFFVSLIFLLLNCKKPEDRTCFKPIGEEASILKDISNFNFVEVKDYVDVYFIPDTIEFAEIEGGKNLLNHIVVEQQENKIFISNNNKCDWVRKYTNPVKIKIHYKNFTTLEYQSSGNVYFTDTLITSKFTINQRGGSGTCNLLLNTDSCFLNIHTGPGDFNVSGITNNCIIFCNGNGFIDASRLFAYYSFVNSKGTGDTKINTVLHLDAIIGYVGNIYYFGNPPIVNMELKGKGQLIKAD